MGIEEGKLLHCSLAKRRKRKAFIEAASQGKVHSFPREVPLAMRGRVTLPDEWPHSPWWVTRCILESGVLHQGEWDRFTREGSLRVKGKVIRPGKLEVMLSYQIKRFTWYFIYIISKNDESPIPKVCYLLLFNDLQGIPFGIGFLVLAWI